jgi:hypothetical protein
MYQSSHSASLTLTRSYHVDSISHHGGTSHHGGASIDGGYLQQGGHHSHHGTPSLHCDTHHHDTYKHHGNGGTSYHGTKHHGAIGHHGCTSHHGDLERLHLGGDSPFHEGFHGRHLAPSMSQSLGQNRPITTVCSVSFLTKSRHQIKTPLHSTISHCLLQHSIS